MHTLINHKGTALVLALFISVALSLISLVIMEKIIPVSVSVRGIENSNNAHYLAFSGVEEAMDHMRKEDPGKWAYGLWSSGQTVQKYTLNAQNTFLPVPGEGTSEYDKNWNRIAPGQPVQLSLSGIMDATQVSQLRIAVRIPNVDTGSTESLTGANGSGYINWTLSSSAGTGVIGYASGEINTIKNSELLTDGADCNPPSVPCIDLSSRALFNVKSPTTVTNLASFYTTYCTATTACVLKLSMMRPPVLANGLTLPYLEYRVIFPISQPQQYATIQSEGTFRGFKQTITQKVRQQTDSEILDFTVFQ